MKKVSFETEKGILVPTVNEAQMREVDRVAVEEIGLAILQMMENAGRNLAHFAMNIIGPPPSDPVVILAGSGGNGGGGLCCARHLHNHGYSVRIFLSKKIEKLQGAAKIQMNILTNAGIIPGKMEEAEKVFANASLIIDALIGYSLQGPPRGKIADLISLANHHSNKVLSLDIPSGIDSSSGVTQGIHIKAMRTITLALPKTGLHHPATGEIYLADIGIPPEVYQTLDIHFEPLFKTSNWIKLIRKTD